jgi:DNA ligase (NAD+)
MNKELTKKELDALEKELLKASEVYYNSDELLMSDEEFDKKKDLYEAQRGPLEFGAAPRSSKGLVEMNHKYDNLLGTLGKVNNLEELQEWLENILLPFNIMSSSNKPHTLGISYKYDGNSIYIEYKNGKVVQALTRGKAGKGMDVTDVFKNETIEYKGPVAIQYEVVMTYENYELIKKETGTEYANPRSVVAGKLGDLDAPSFRKYFTLVPLGARKPSPLTRESELTFIQEFADIHEIKFIDTYDLYEGHFAEDFVETIRGIYDGMTTERFNLSYMIDGLVIELIGPNFEGMGWSNGKPKNKVALKFPYMEKESVVTGIEFDYGNSSRITPCVTFEPVTFNGAVQQRVSLANRARFDELKLGVGSKILVQYRKNCDSY